MTTIKDMATSLGQYLRNHRINRNDRQIDFAARIGVGLSTYRAMEAGDPRVSLEAWLKVASLLGRDGELLSVFEPRDGGLIEALLNQEKIAPSVRQRVRKARG